MSCWDIMCKILDRQNRMKNLFTRRKVSFVVKIKWCGWTTPPTKVLRKLIDFFGHEFLPLTNEYHNNASFTKLLWELSEIFFFWDTVRLWAQTGIKVVILLPQLPKCWDYKLALSCLLIFARHLAQTLALSRHYKNNIYCT
jgi:hypothetical protein